MRARYVAAARVLLVIATLTFAGCDSSETASSVKVDFAPGAFPPTLSGEEYHGRSWTREDCLVCHEIGVKEAPKMRHISLPEIAASAKCRTCHVLIADQKAPK